MTKIINTCWLRVFHEKTTLIPYHKSIVAHKLSKFTSKFNTCNFNGNFRQQNYRLTLYNCLLCSRNRTKKGFWDSWMNMFLDEPSFKILCLDIIIVKHKEKTMVPNVCLSFFFSLPFLFFFLFLLKIHCAYLQIDNCINNFQAHNVYRTVPLNYPNQAAHETPVLPKPSFFLYLYGLLRIFFF